MGATCAVGPVGSAVYRLPKVPVAASVRATLRISYPGRNARWCRDAPWRRILLQREGARATGVASVFLQVFGSRALHPPNRFKLRALALAACSSRFLGAAVVSRDAIRRADTAATSS